MPSRRQLLALLGPACLALVVATLWALGDRVYLHAKDHGIRFRL